MKIKYESYLTEQKLGSVLKSLAKARQLTLKAQWKIGRGRCDFALFRKDEIEPFVVYEFDGFRHYNSYATQQADKNKDILLTNAGIRIIRIPYFLQLHEDVAHIFIPTKETLIFDVNYLHGFIDKIALRPVDYNEYGLKKFLTQLQLLPQSTACAVWQSLRINDVPESLISIWTKFNK